MHIQDEYTRPPKENSGKGQNKKSIFRVKNSGKRRTDVRFYDPDFSKVTS